MLKCWHLLKEFVAQEVKCLSAETVILITTKPKMVQSFPHIHEMVSAFTFLFTFECWVHLFSSENVKNGTTYPTSKQTTSLQVSLRQNWWDFTCVLLCFESWVRFAVLLWPRYEQFTWHIFIISYILQQIIELQCSISIFMRYYISKCRNIFSVSQISIKWITEF